LRRSGVTGLLMSNWNAQRSGSRSCRRTAAYWCGLLPTYRPLLRVESTSECNPGFSIATPLARCGVNPYLRCCCSISRKGLWMTSNWWELWASDRLHALYWRDMRKIYNTTPSKYSTKPRYRRTVVIALMLYFILRARCVPNVAKWSICHQYNEYWRLTRLYS